MENRDIIGTREIERAVIGHMLIDPENTVGRVISTGGGILFSTTQYLVIFRALEYLHEHGEPIDQLTVTDRLTRDNTLNTAGGEVSIAGIISDTVSTASIGYYLEILCKYATLRRIAVLTSAIGHRCYEPGVDADRILDEFSSEIAELKSFAGENATLMDQVREWVLSSDGVFLSSDIYKDLGLSSRVLRKNCSQILTRLAEEGLIERYGARRGQFRRIEGDCERMDWKNADCDVMDIRWPGKIERYVEIMPGNVAVIAGEPNAGKTAFLLNFVRWNMARHDIHYFSSEMGASEMHKRISRFEGIRPSDWNFTPWERSADFADVVKPDSLNIIDYMEIHEDFYRLGGHIKAVFDRLKSGVAVIAIQKNMNTNIGRGGMATMEKPRLYLSMKPGELAIVKGKNWASHENPNGLSCSFKLVNGARFLFDEWSRN